MNFEAFFRKKKAIFGADFNLKNTYERYRRPITSLLAGKQNPEQQRDTASAKSASTHQQIGKRRPNG
jgi:hypothetical protein